MFQLVLPVPHGAIGKTQSAHRCAADDRQPDLNGGVFLRVPPACRELARQPLRQRLARVGAAIAMLPCHLRNQPVRWLALRLRPDGVVNAQQAIPIGVVTSTEWSFGSRPKALINALKDACCVGNRSTRARYAA